LATFDQYKCHCSLSIIQGNCTVESNLHLVLHFLQARGGIGSEKVNKKKSMAIQQYAMRFLRSSSLESLVQPKALARTKWHSERTSSSILEPFQEDQFPEVLSVELSSELVICHPI
jgi:hypothetical protein